MEVGKGGSKLSQVHPGITDDIANNGAKSSKFFKDLQAVGSMTLNENLLGPALKSRVVKSVLIQMSFHNIINSFGAAH